jgi:hypothetical protein
MIYPVKMVDECCSQRNKKALLQGNRAMSFFSKISAMRLRSKRLTGDSSRP